MTLPLTMLWTGKRRFVKRFTLKTFKILILIFIVIFMVVPFIFKFSYKLQQSVVFPNFVNLPRRLNNPLEYDLKGARNFYIESDENIKLGVWHILPESLSHNKTTDQYFETLLNNGQNVLIYNHGNSANRAAPYRIELYKILQRHFHVITFDYRSYGDSSDATPTETNLIKDCIAIYKWVANKTNSDIFVWGHSLGTALSTHMISLLSTQNIKPSGLILESPFTNMRDEISEYPLSQLFRSLPWFHYTVVEPMQNNNFTFANDKYILNIDCPILILHAVDDRIVPYKLGYKLYQETLRLRKPYQGSVEFVGFAKKFGYGHKQICRAPELPKLIKNFVLKAVKEMKKLHTM